MCSSDLHDKKQGYHSSDDKLVITYIVDSPGGCVDSILKFVDFLTLARTKYPYVEFVSIITGFTASAGTIMALVADKRYMTRNASAMIHELSSGSSGMFTHLDSYMKHLKTIHDKLVTVYLDNSKMKKSQVEALLKDETWYDAKAYLKAGFVDKII